MKAKKLVLWMLVLLVAFGFAFATMSCDSGGDDDDDDDDDDTDDDTDDHSDECHAIVDALYDDCDGSFYINDIEINADYAYESCRDEWDDAWACMYECYKATTYCEDYKECLDLCMEEFW